MTYLLPIPTAFHLLPTAYHLPPFPPPAFCRHLHTEICRFIETALFKYCFDPSGVFQNHPSWLNSSQMSGTHIQLRYHIPSVLSERISKEFIANVCVKSEMFILVSFCRYSAYNICICSSIISDWLSIEGNQETQKPYIDICIMIKNQ